MKTLMVAPRRVIRSTSARVSSSVSGDGGQSNHALAVARQVRGRLAVGDHQHDRLGVRVPAR